MFKVNVARLLFSNKKSLFQNVNRNKGVYIYLFCSSMEYRNKDLIIFFVICSVADLIILIMRYKSLIAVIYLNDCKLNIMLWVLLSCLLKKNFGKYTSLLKSLLIMLFIFKVLSTYIYSLKNTGIQEYNVGSVIYSYKKKEICTVKYRCDYIGKIMENQSKSTWSFKMGFLILCGPV